MSDARLFSALTISQSEEDESCEDLDDLIEEKKLEISACRDKLLLLEAINTKELRPHQLKMFFEDEPSLLVGIPAEKISQAELVNLIKAAVATDGKVLNLEREYKSARAYLVANTQARPLPKLPSEYKTLKNQAKMLIATIYDLINVNKIAEIRAETYKAMELHKADLNTLFSKQTKEDLRNGLR